LALGKQAEELVLFFEGCRRKRNVIDYVGAQTVTATEAAEVLERAQEFGELVEGWMKGVCPGLC
jgi:hypothetical protein